MLSGLDDWTPASAFEDEAIAVLWALRSLNGDGAQGPNGTKYVLPALSTRPTYHQKKIAMRTKHLATVLALVAALFGAATLPATLDVAAYAGDRVSAQSQR